MIVDLLITRNSYLAFFGYDHAFEYAYDSQCPSDVPLCVCIPPLTPTNTHATPSSPGISPQSERFLAFTFIPSPGQPDVTYDTSPSPSPAPPSALTLRVAVLIAMPAPPQPPASQAVRSAYSYEEEDIPHVEFGYADVEVVAGVEGGGEYFICHGVLLNALTAHSHSPRPLHARTPYPLALSLHVAA